MKDKLWIGLVIAAVSVVVLFGAQPYGGLQNAPITLDGLNFLQDKAATIGGDVTFSGTTTLSGALSTSKGITSSSTLAVAGATTLDALTVTNALVNSALTASLPLFSSSTKSLETKTVANTKLALGIQVGSGTTAADGTATNTFGTAFGSAPKVVVQVTGGSTTVLTNAVSSVTTTTFIVNLGSDSKTFDYIAIGAP